MRAEIDVWDRVETTRERTGEPHRENVVHMVSKDNSIVDASREQLEERNKPGAAAVLLNTCEPTVIADADEIVVKPMLPKIMLLKFHGEVTEFKQSITVIG